MSVIHLLLQRREERLHLAVVQAVALSGHALNNAIFLEAVHKHFMLVLESLVGMYHHSLVIWMALESRIKHLHYHRHVRRRGDVVAYYLSGAQILYRR